MAGNSAAALMPATAAAPSTSWREKLRPFLDLLVYW